MRVIRTILIAGQDASIDSRRAAPAARRWSKFRGLVELFEPDWGGGRLAPASRFTVAVVPANPTSGDGLVDSEQTRSPRAPVGPVLVAAAKMVSMDPMASLTV